MGHKPYVRFYEGESINLDGNPDFGLTKSEIRTSEIKHSRTLEFPFQKTIFKISCKNGRKKNHRND